MDTFRLPKRIRVLSTDNNSCMFRLQTMQFDEITPIEGQHDSVVLGCEGKHLSILNSLSRLARFQGSQNIMTQTAQCFHDLKREVFVGV